MNQCGTFDNGKSYYQKLINQKIQYEKQNQNLIIKLLRISGYQFKQYTGSCYKPHYEKQTWFTAYNICAAEGGHLVVLDDREEARIVKAMFPPQTGEVDDWVQFHIGLRAWGDSRTWITINGTNTTTSRYPTAQRKPLPINFFFFSI